MERHATPVVAGIEYGTLGQWGLKKDPQYRGRRQLTKGLERIDDKSNAKMPILLATGDPRGGLRVTWHARDALRGLHDIADSDLPNGSLRGVAGKLADRTMPDEVSSVAGTRGRWHDKILAWHTTLATNGPTEGMRDFIKRIKCGGTGFSHFAHYRIRVPHYPGRPNWAVLDTITPR
jgi:hypothetical protein